MNKTKKALAFLLALLVTITGLPFGMEVRAEQFGDYEYEENEDETSITITGYNGSSGEITIPSEIEGKQVTSIGKHAFLACFDLKEVIIPKGVTSIGDGAFFNSGLEKMDIPEGVTSIGKNAFAVCGDLASVTIPDSVKYIGDGAFSNCYNLTDVVIPFGVTSIGIQTFSESGVVNVSIPEGVTSIGEKAFYRCDDLNRIIIPSSVMSIGKMAFGYLYGGYDENDEEISKKNPDFLIYGTSGTAAENYAKENGFLFNPPDLVYETNEDGNSVTITSYRGNGGEFTIPSEIDGKKVTNIGEEAFSEEKGENLTSVCIPNSVTDIGELAFKGCSSLASVEIQSGVAKIGRQAFAECALTSVSIPEGAVYIGDEAFYRCSDLTSVSIPGSVRSIGSSAFYNCSSLTSVSIADGVTSIENNVFAECSSLTSVSIPGSVGSIGSDAFYNCSSLASVSIADGVTIIGDYAFHYCNALMNVDIPGSVSSIGDQAFGYVLSWSQWGPVPEKNPDFIIRGVSKTAAETYAEENGFIFESLDAAENISKATVTLEKSSYTYDGKVKTPSVTVKLNGKTLVLNKDYTVSYSNNTNAGIAKVTVTGIGSYTGSKSVDFTITKAGQNVSITCKKMVYEAAYGAKPFKINAVSSSKLTFASSDTKVASVDKNTGKVTIKNTGVTTITVKAGSNCVKVTVKVSPKKQTIKSAKAVKGKKLTVSWAKDKMASGYEVQVSSSKNFKKDMKSKNVTKTSYRFTKLKAGKKYYVRVRSYKTVKVNGKKQKLYGSWSKSKAVTAKK